MHSYHGRQPYIFFSYCHADKDEVMLIAEKLYNAGYRIWYDKALEAGKPFDDDIADHIKACDVFVIFLSKHYLQSQYCDMELKFAVENGRKCFAIYLDEADLSAHSGMAMCLRTPNNLYKKRISEEEFYDKLCGASLLEECKRGEDEEEVDLSVRERLKPVPVASCLSLILLYVITGFAYLLRSISVALNIEVLSIAGMNISLIGATTAIHIIVLILTAVMLYRSEKMYTHPTHKNSTFSTYELCGIVFNFDLAVLPLINAQSALMQVLGGLLMAFLTLLPMTAGMERKTLPCLPFNYLNAMLFHMISIFLIVLLYGDNYRWTSFVLLIWVLLYPGLAIMEKNKEDKEIRWAIHVSCIIGFCLDGVFIIFILFAGLFNLLMSIADSYMNFIYKLLPF